MIYCVKTQKSYHAESVKTQVGDFGVFKQSLAGLRSRYHE